jgi:ribosomal protein S18 acetylase RimI-like enzyme
MSKGKPDILVRQLTAADVPKVRELHVSFDLCYSCCFCFLTHSKALILPVKYPSSFFHQLLIFPSRICLVAFCTSNPVAFISASMRWTTSQSNVFRASESVSESPRLEQHHIEILTLGVLPEYQQRGLARHLIHRVYHYFRDPSNPAHHLETLIYANVATSNVSALSFYERMGMRVSSDVIRNMYRTCSSGCRDGYLIIGSLTTPPCNADSHNGKNDKSPCQGEMSSVFCQQCLPCQMQWRKVPQPPNLLSKSILRMFSTV